MTISNGEGKPKEYFYTCEFGNTSNDTNIQISLLINSSIWNSLLTRLYIDVHNIYEPITQKLEGKTYMKLACKSMLILFTIDFFVAL